MKTDRASTETHTFHDGRLARRLEEPEFRDEFERATREIRAIDAIVNELDSLRTDHGMTKAELAREIGKNPATVRRLFTAPANPELRTIVAIADALDADVVILPRTRGAIAKASATRRRSGQARRGLNRSARRAVAGAG